MCFYEGKVSENTMFLTGGAGEGGGAGDLSFELPRISHPFSAAVVEDSSYPKSSLQLRL
jgi:hypothetical protein